VKPENVKALMAEEEIDGLDFLGLSRFLQRRGDALRAHSTYSQAIDLGLPFAFDRQARHELALLAKRRGDHEQAVTLWLELAKDEENGVHACEQLAMYYERRVRNFSRALEFAKLALAKARRAQSFSHDSFAGGRNLRIAERLVSRIARLEGRIRASESALPTLPLEPPSRVLQQSKLKN
jgi:tetratricopeptide (TPR) repeat protein